MFLSSLMDLLAFCASTLGLRLRFYSCVAFAVLFPALAARRFSSPRTVVVFVPGSANELSTLTRTSRKNIAALLEKLCYSAGFERMRFVRTRPFGAEARARKHLAG